MAYEPLYSIWDGDESELLRRMIEMYLGYRPDAILDATINRGRIWRGLDFPVKGVDRNPANTGNRIPTLIADNTHLPMFENGEFDVVVYDPPHVPEQGKGSKDFGIRFGLDDVEGTLNLRHTYEPFLREAMRLIKHKGILLVKLIDYTHRNRFEDATRHFANAAETTGFIMEGKHHKTRKGPIIDPKWKKASHPRQTHSTWLVFRKVEDG